MTVKPTPECVEIEVEDDGPGIPEAERGKVFDRFYRLDHSRSTAGSGLGLALVKAIAGLHGLSIEAQRRNDAATARLYAEEAAKSARMRLQALV